MISLNLKDETIFHEYCSINLDGPINLTEIYDKNPFIYDRNYGFFYCRAGYHSQAAKFLIALHNGFKTRRGLQLNSKIMDFSKNYIDYLEFWMQNYPGTCFRSSVGNGIYCIKNDFNSLELATFGDIIKL